MLLENLNKKYNQIQIRTRPLWAWVCKNFHRRNFFSKGFNKNLWTGSISWWIYQDNDILLITQPFSALFRMKTVFICSGASQMSNVTYHFVSHVSKIILYIMYCNLLYVAVLFWRHIWDGKNVLANFGSQTPHYWQT